MDDITFWNSKKKRKGTRKVEKIISPNVFYMTWDRLSPQWLTNPELPEDSICVLNIKWDMTHEKNKRIKLYCDPKLYNNIIFQPLDKKVEFDTKDIKLLEYQFQLSVKEQKYKQAIKTARTIYNINKKDEIIGNQVLLKNMIMLSLTEMVPSYHVTTFIWLYACITRGKYISRLLFEKILTIV